MTPRMSVSSSWTVAAGENPTPRFELMSARRAVKAALEASDDTAERSARARVQDAKVALGERGQPWWEEPLEETQRERLAATIRALLRKRGPGKTICPRDAARVCGGKQWRDLMDAVRHVAWTLRREGWLKVTQAGEPIDADTPDEITGPVRLERCGRDPGA